MKKICFFLIIFLYQTFSYAKTTENIEFNHKYLSNYFSAIISINNQDDKDSLKYLNNTKSLVKTHESYLENYLISLVLNNKIDIAFNKAIQLKANETNFFEAKVLLALNSINKKDFSNAMLTLEKMDEVPLDTLELIIKETLKDYLDTIIFKKMDKNEDVQFGEIDKIKKIFQSCYLGKENTDLLFEELVIKDTEDFSRYIFFYINYLAQIKDFNKINELQNKIDYTNSSILIAQAKQWIENKRYDKITSVFSCKNEHHIISEFLFLISNLYSSQELYKKSNFYIHLSNYLNPEFNFNNSLNQWDKDFWFDSNLDFNITKQWSLSYSARFDVMNSEIVRHNLMIYRPLHCWMFSFQWYPGIGPNNFGNGFQLLIKVKNPDLQDIRLKHTEGNMFGF